jgi:hypothetical protein
MKNFAKLKNKFIIDDYTIQQIRVWYGTKDNDKFKGIWYSDVKYQNKDTIFNIIPVRFRPYFNMLSMEVNTRIPPHTDSRILSTINFYIKADNCLTQFYEFKSENLTKTQTENQTNGYLFKLDELETVNSFIAKPNDAYLLDVTKPHSVIPLQITNTHRSAIALQTNKFTFDEVLEMLKETNNV